MSMGPTRGGLWFVVPRGERGGSGTPPPRLERRVVGSNIREASRSFFNQNIFVRSCMSVNCVPTYKKTKNIKYIVQV